MGGKYYYGCVRRCGDGAMTPLITIQILGLVFRMRAAKVEKEEQEAYVSAFDGMGDMEIIEL